MGLFGPIFDPFFDHFLTIFLEISSDFYWFLQKSVIFGDLVFEKNEKKFHEKITNFGLFEKVVFSCFYFCFKMMIFDHLRIKGDFPWQEPKSMKKREKK